MTVEPNACSDADADRHGVEGWLTTDVRNYWTLWLVVTDSAGGDDDDWFGWKLTTYHDDVNGGKKMQEALSLCF